MTVNRKAVVIWGLALFAFWFLNYNGGLQRYNDQIRNCRLSRDFVTSQNAEGWREAEHARHSASMRLHLPADHLAVVKYHRIHTSLDRFLRIPCTKRYHHPGFFG